MLILLSPAKKLDFAEAPPAVPHSLPQFAEQSALLADLMRRKKPPAIGKLMSISKALAQLNYDRWQQWCQPDEPNDACRQALYAFQGDVYQGLKARDLSDEDIDWAQRHLRILSGLHGLLRPLDLIRPYRLEMGTSLKNPGGKNLYALWQKRLTAALCEQLEATGAGWLLNLASAEYAEAVHLTQLPVPVVSPQFQSMTRSGWRSVMFNTKRARGTLAAWAIRNRPETPAQLADFASADYHYEAELSTPERPLFRLQKQAPRA